VRDEDASRSFRSFFARSTSWSRSPGAGQRGGLAGAMPVSPVKRSKRIWIGCADGHVE
jgi:hypothetical protein